MLALFLAACTATYNITIREDYSAHVSFTIEVGEEGSQEYSLFDQEDSAEMKMAEDTLRQFYASDQITNLAIDVVNGKWIIEYDIKNIDSLGNYIHPIALFTYPVQFSHTDKSLVIEGSSGTSSQLEDICGCTDLVKINMNLIFERPIKKIITKNPYCEKVSSTEVQIRTSIGQMDFGGIQNRVEIKLK